ncbi:hypothetical protein [Kribbella sp. CA-293567]|uniref:hypothetical protein n=1 Tax=Kribbella sp. CA-293567 TaxID=3002436 RepID=UPI0022DDCB41|nr:hypothetical protein [Kribbella sp. CA-293567]WBQ03825.1 hypothetical protein OX958_28125 [Kribbella sp. CA-293567]
MTLTRFTALDGDTITITPGSTIYNDGVSIAEIDATACPLDREGTVRVIEALTDLVQAADVAEAEKLAAEATRLAAPFKAGERVYGNRTQDSYTVVSDQTAHGTASFVHLRTGDLKPGYLTRNFHRMSRTVSPF